MNRPVACWFGLSAALAVISAVLLRDAAHHLSDAIRVARSYREIM